MFSASVLNVKVCQNDFCCLILKNSEKFRKSDLALLQNNKQMEFGSMLDDDVSKVNSFLYSNVLCLNKDSNVVEQFSK